MILLTGWGSTATTTSFLPSGTVTPTTITSTLSPAAWGLTAASGTANGRPGGPSI